jgi:hypothetical protein
MKGAMNRVLLLFLVFAFSAGPLLSADELPLDPGEVSNHIRESVSVSGLVVTVFVSKRGNVFLNFELLMPGRHRSCPGYALD